MLSTKLLVFAETSYGSIAQPEVCLFAVISYGLIAQPEVCLPWLLGSTSAYQKLKGISTYMILKLGTIASLQSSYGIFI
jgi:hypothetical protein